MQPSLRHNSDCWRLNWQSSRTGPRIWNTRRPGRRPERLVRGFGDDLLDFIEAGPKMRKWYGEGERLPEDGDFDPAKPPASTSEPAPSGPADEVLVLDADSTMGEAVLTQLVLKRKKVRALVRDAQGTAVAFGEYVAPIQGSPGNEEHLGQALRRARAVICAGRLGALAAVAPKSQLQHIVLLCSGSEAGGIARLLGGEQAILSDTGRWAQVKRLGIPHTVVCVGRIRDMPPSEGLCFFQGEGEAQPSLISREDLAAVLVEALDHVPASHMAFSVAERQPGAAVSGFQSLKEVAVAAS